MGREIKFRAWNVEGNQFWDDSLGDWKIQFLNGNEPTLIVLEETFSPYGEQEFYWRDVENVVFQEYTGLKDRNDKEIYEGDILKCKATKRFFRGEFDWVGETQIVFKSSVIEWWKSDCNIGYRLRDGNGKTMMVKPSSLGKMEVEVIGNIYENPELLEEKHE